jgi:tetratricopeptide (TPR) repeat protein
MTQDLRLAVEYLTDLEAELEARATSDDPRTRSAARDSMRFQLGRVRELIAGLEVSEPDVKCLHTIDKQDVVIDLEELRIWCHIVEAKIMRFCYDDHASAIGWMQRALAIDPSRAGNHALYALFLSDARQHDRALEAIDRAISLEPEHVTFHKVRDDIIRSAVPVPDSTPDYPWWHVGRYFT